MSFFVRSLQEMADLEGGTRKGIFLLQVEARCPNALPPKSLHCISHLAEIHSLFFFNFHNSLFFCNSLYFVIYSFGDKNFLKIKGRKRTQPPKVNQNYFHILYCQHPGYETVICWITELLVKSLRIVEASLLFH